MVWPRGSVLGLTLDGFQALVYRGPVVGLTLTVTEAAGAFVRPLSLCLLFRLSNGATLRYAVGVSVLSTFLLM
jgi:hypothetical protein